MALTAVGLVRKRRPVPRGSGWCWASYAAKTRVPRSTSMKVAENSVQVVDGVSCVPQSDACGGLLIVLAVQVRFVAEQENGQLIVTVDSCTNRCTVL